MTAAAVGLIVGDGTLVSVDKRVAVAVLLGKGVSVFIVVGDAVGLDVFVGLGDLVGVAGTVIGGVLVSVAVAETVDVGSAGTVVTGGNVLVAGARVGVVAITVGEGVAVLP